MVESESKARIDVVEPLGDSAPLALNWSKQHCVQANDKEPGCAWYHGSWQMLRWLDVFQSIRSDDDFFLPALAGLINDGARHILISGAADYALLARVIFAAGEQAKELRVTVVDLCDTPLRLNAWYAEKLGVKVTVIKDDVLNFKPEQPFDLICAHSFLCFFDSSERRQLLQAWWDCLKPAGKVITAQRARTEDHQAVIAYSQAEVIALGERAYNLARDQFDAKEVDPDLARQLAEGYGRFHWTYLIRTPQEIRNLFEDQGFNLETFSPPENERLVDDTPGTPNKIGSVRWRILACKPTS